MAAAPRSPSSVALRPAGDVVSRVVALAPAPLLLGEKEADYVVFAERIVEACGPRDAIEELLVRDVVDLAWEILRLRRIKAGILKASMGEGVASVLASVGSIERNSLSQKWAAGDKGARKRVEDILSKAELSIHEVTAEALAKEIDAFERLDRMLASTEARRNTALREIDRHRESAGAEARRAVEEVQDVEFRDVETAEIGGASAP